MSKKAESATAIGGQSPTNGAKDLISMNEPYRVDVEIEGTSDILFHRWNCEAVEAKAKANKNSKLKKSDDVESYVYRDENGELALPGEYVRMAVIYAAKFRQDPRSSRKSAMDLFKAAIVCETDLASLGVKEWDYEDRRRVTVQRAGITRTRPALKSGWKARFTFTILMPEYIDPHQFHETLTQAGKLIGVGDFRPTFGRFQITHFEVIKHDEMN